MKFLTYNKQGFGGSKSGNKRYNPVKNSMQQKTPNMTLQLNVSDIQFYLNITLIGIYLQTIL